MTNHDLLQQLIKDIYNLDMYYSVGGIRCILLEDIEELLLQKLDDEE